jgi:hypothetical protein
MLNQIIISQWFVELTDEQQELLTGGADSQQNSNNFAQKLAVTKTTNTAGPQGNITNTNTQLSDINSGTQSILSFGGQGFPPLGGLNLPIPGSLGNSAITPATSFVAIS